MRLEWKESVPAPVVEICRMLHRFGHRGWIVGGCVRDLLMGRAVSDWDLATTALPGEVQRTFRRTIPTGIDHGTVTVVYKGATYEVTTLRGEGAYSDGRRPDSVEFVSDIAEDLARRDFTINAIAYDPLTDELVDPWGGLDDLRAGLIRAVRSPEERFREDGLRVLRGARFCATLAFRLEAHTEAAMPAGLHAFRQVSMERVRDEWEKTLRAERPSPAFDVMRRTGLLAVTCPPLSSLPADRFAHALSRMDAAPAKDPDLRWAALVLDLASETAPDFVDSWLRQMRCSNPQRRRIAAAVASAQPPDGLSAPVALRRWLSRLGREVAQDVLRLLELEAAVGGPDRSELVLRAGRVLGSDFPLRRQDLPIAGKDVLAELSLTPGPEVGLILDYLHERVTEDPTLADRAVLLAMLPAAYQHITDRT